MRRDIVYPRVVSVTGPSLQSITAERCCLSPWRVPGPLQTQGLSACPSRLQQELDPSPLPHPHTGNSSAILSALGSLCSGLCTLHTWVISPPPSRTPCPPCPCPCPCLLALGSPQLSPFCPWPVIAEAFPVAGVPTPAARPQRDNWINPVWQLQRRENCP